jgi:Cu/Ag efflux pump CusA
VQDAERTLVISVVLVVLVVFVFLRDLRATLIPSVAVPVSLIGTFVVMYLLWYSLDNLSLMALTISTGFVVDDGIVVLENITRYREEGMSDLDAAYKGAAESAFQSVEDQLSALTILSTEVGRSGLRSHRLVAFWIWRSHGSKPASRVIRMSSPPKRRSSAIATEL